MFRPLQAQCHILPPPPLLGQADILGGADGGEAGFELDGAVTARTGPEFLEGVMGGGFAFLVVPREVPGLTAVDVWVPRRLDPWIRGM